MFDSDMLYVNRRICVLMLKINNLQPFFVFIRFGVKFHIKLNMFDSHMLHDNCIACIVKIPSEMLFAF